MSEFDDELSHQADRISVPTGPFDATMVASAPRRPSLLPVFVVPSLALLAALVLQAVIVVAWISMHSDANSINTGESAKKMQSEPWMFLVLAFPTELAVLVAAVVAGRAAPEGPRLSLGLARASLAGWNYPVFIVASTIPLTVGLLMAQATACVLPPDNSLSDLYQRMTPVFVAVFVPFIALAPGLCEEVLFRGYVQRRLLQRWSPWAAIAMSSLLFSLMHLDPSHVALALPLGVWLGVLAWRTGSIWPGVLCHASVNGLWNAFQIPVVQGDIGESVQYTVIGIAWGLGLICFVIALAILYRRRQAIPLQAYPVFQTGIVG